MTSGPSGEDTEQDNLTETGLQTEKLDVFIKAIKKDGKYSFSGTKTITGDSSPYKMTFTCSIDGDDYAMRVITDTSTLRQLFIDGVFSLADDTKQTVYENFSYYSIPTSHLEEAYNGRIIRVREDILNGQQVQCFELYANNIIYELYFNEQGKPVRFYYIYEDDETTIDFYDFIVNDSSSVSFKIPSAYQKQLNGSYFDED